MIATPDGAGTVDPTMMWAVLVSPVEESSQASGVPENQTCLTVTDSVNKCLRQNYETGSGCSISCGGTRGKGRQNRAGCRCGVCYECQRLHGYRSGDIIGEVAAYPGGQIRGFHGLK